MTENLKVACLWGLVFRLPQLQPSGARIDHGKSNPWNQNLTSATLCYFVHVSRLQAIGPGGIAVYLHESRLWRIELAPTKEEGKDRAHLAFLLNAI